MDNKDIDIVISKLHPINDILIISLLERKKDNYIYNNVEVEKLTEREIKIAKSRLDVHLRKEVNDLLNINKRYKKMERICDTVFNCGEINNHCKLAKYKESYSMGYHVKYMKSDDNSKVCENCFNRSQLLHDEMKKMETNYYNEFKNHVTDDFIKCKALAAKLNRKIEQLKNKI